MSFGEFECSIASVALKDVARHWNEMRGNRTAPAWRDMQPRKIATTLPLVWAYTYDRQKDAFTGRIAGDRIVETFGKSFRGVSLAEIQPPEAFLWVHGLLRRVVTESLAYRGTGRVFQQFERYGRGERIILPLDGADGEGVLGATEYHSSDFTPGISANPVSGTESWFSLAN